MSLINKMLQDLDARGSQSGADAQDAVRPVPGRERAVTPRALLIAAAIVLLAGAAAALSWRALQRPASPPPPQVVVAPAVVAPKVTPAPAAATPPVAAPQAVSAEPVVAAIPPAAQESAAPKTATVKTEPAKVNERSKTGERVKTSKRINAEETKAVTVAPSTPARTATLGAATLAPSAPASQPGKESNSQQRAENEYRRALAALQEGRVNESVAGLEQALAIEPRHQAARETLIRLLLEGKRQSEAVRHLQLGLGFDPAQPAMAMMLARLQLESGGPAVDTLMRTLPYAGGDGEYRAFLAAVLQRGQRHKEAAEQYELALRGAPQNGVWWMGLGISLQAEQRLGDARDAFTRARASASLTPELQGFVERKLQQLPR